MWLKQLLSYTSETFWNKVRLTKDDLDACNKELANIQINTNDGGLAKQHP